MNTDDVLWEYVDGVLRLQLTDEGLLLVLAGGIELAVPAVQVRQLAETFLECIAPDDRHAE